MYIHIQMPIMEYYSTIKKNMRSSSFARTWVDLEGIRISEKKVKKINNFRISLICGI